MIDVARFSDADRRDLFRNTAAKVGMSDSIAEKDFWVCEDHRDETNGFAASCCCIQVEVLPSHMGQLSRSEARNHQAGSP